MDFIDKVSNMAKGIAGGAKDVAGNAMIALKINSIEHKIDELKSKLGFAVWKEYRMGKNSEDSSDKAEASNEIDCIILDIDNLYKQIESLNLQRDSFSSEAEAQSADPEDEWDEIKYESPMKRSCAKCDAALEDEWLFCPVCGEPVHSAEPEPSEPETRICSCGAELSSDQNFCPFCGKKL